MPACVTCGFETPREQMYGAPDELRCRACAQKSYAPFETPRRAPSVKAHAAVTITVGVAAAIATLWYGSDRTGSVRYLIADGREVWRGEVWRFLTSVLPHVNLLHLVFNLYWLWQFGRAVEAWMGSFLYAGFILLVAAGSSATSFLASEHGIGLSGVGYALFGLLYALRRDKGFAAEQVPPQIVRLFVGWFFLCIVLTYTNVMPIGNVAHGAGAVLGWLVGKSLLLRRRIAALAGISVLVLGLVAATQQMPWNGEYALDRAIRYARQKNYAEALIWCRKAAQAYPHNRDLEHYLRYLEQSAKGLNNEEIDE